MPGRQLRIDEYRIEQEPYYPATGDEVAIAEAAIGKVEYANHYICGFCAG